MENFKAPAGLTGPAARMRQALSLARRGELQQARVEARRALEEGATPQRAAAAGHLFFATRDYHEALWWLERAHEAGAGAGALWMKFQRAWLLGWEREAREALERGAAAQPLEPRWREALLVLLARRRDHAVALAHGDELLASHPRRWGALLEAAAVLAERGERAEVRRRLGLAEALPLSDEARVEVARLYRLIGAFDEASARLERLAAGPCGAAARRMLAELALWSGQPDRAEALARSLPERGAAAALLCAVAAARGRRGEARALAAEALAADPACYEAHAWLGELLSDEGQHQQALAHQEQASIGARGALFVVHLLRARSHLRAGSFDGPIGPSELDHLLPAMTRLCPELAGALASGEREAWAQAIERYLAASHGNRSTTPTWLRGGALELVDPGPEPRADARRALEQIRVGDSAEILAGLEALARRFPRSGLPDAHRGELLLWLGRASEARSALERAIQVSRGTRWAYIGLTMCDILDGEPERALETSARGVFIMRDAEGPAVHVHRGEALRLLGRLDEAEGDLTRAVSLHPSRVGAWLNLGLLRLAQGDHAGARQALERAFQFAPGLLSDAARAAGQTLFVDGRQVNAPAVGPTLERALAMAQGNRSSSTCSYLSPEGTLRFGHHGGAPRQSVHDDDERLLAQAEVLLRGGR